MSASNGRIHLSPPRATEADIDAVTRAMRSGWLAPTGPDLAAFETGMAAYLGVGHAVGLSSGTAAIHLALRYLGVGPGDAVIVPTVTFAATVFPATYLGAEPVFVDIDASWNLDPALLADAISATRKRGLRVAAVIPVDLYGTPADYAGLAGVLDLEGIPAIEDAAEGLGAIAGERKVGTFGCGGVLSFNGNKIITTSGGGMLVTNDGDLAQKTKFWSTQARAPLPWYEHEEVGHNYRMSNLLAALGRSQLSRIDDEVEKRRQIRDWYRSHLAALDGVCVQDDPPWGRSNAWLTIAQFDAGIHPDGPTRVREYLERHNIESRPIWKPMHEQPVFASSQAILTGAAHALFQEGLCLPSGTALDDEDVARIASLIIEALRS